MSLYSIIIIPTQSNILYTFNCTNKIKSSHSLFAATSESISCVSAFTIFVTASYFSIFFMSSFCTQLPLVSSSILIRYILLYMSTLIVKSATILTYHCSAIHTTMLVLPWSPSTLTLLSSLLPSLLLLHLSIVPLLALMFPQYCPRYFIFATSIMFPPSTLVPTFVIHLMPFFNTFSLTVLQ